MNWGRTRGSRRRPRRLRVQYAYHCVRCKRECKSFFQSAFALIPVIPVQSWLLSDRKIKLLVRRENQGLEVSTELAGLGWPAPNCDAFSYITLPNTKNSSHTSHILGHDNILGLVSSNAPKKYFPQQSHRTTGFLQLVRWKGMLLCKISPILLNFCVLLDLG